MHKLNTLQFKYVAIKNGNANNNLSMYTIIVNIFTCGYYKYDALNLY